MFSIFWALRSLCVAAKEEKAPQDIYESTAAVWHNTAMSYVRTELIHTVSGTPDYASAGPYCGKKKQKQKHEPMDTPTNRSTHRPPTLYYSSTAVRYTAVKHKLYTAEKPIHHQQPTNPPCVYNSTTAVQQKKKSKKAETRGFELTYLVQQKKKAKKKSGDRGIWTDALLVQNLALLDYRRYFV